MLYGSTHNSLFFLIPAGSVYTMASFLLYNNTGTQASMHIKQDNRKKRKKSVSSAHKLDGLGKLKEHAPRSEHVHLHQDIGHLRKNHLQATLLPQLSKYAHASSITIKS